MYVIFGFAVLAVVYGLHLRLTASVDIEKRLPWVGRKDGFMSKLRTRIASAGPNGLAVLECGYAKVQLALPNMCDAYTNSLAVLEIGIVIHAP